MEKLINKYLRKLGEQGLSDEDKAVLLGLDAEMVSNKPLTGDYLELSKVFDLMNINSLLFAEPSEPYKSIIETLVRNEKIKLVPMDCETRTFLHDIPVVEELTAESIASALSHRKSMIIRNRGIVTYGTVTPEQAFISFSSTCFSTFVKYFIDALMYLEDCRIHSKKPDTRFIEDFMYINKLIQGSNLFTHRTPLITLLKGPPEDEDTVYRMLSQTGREVVRHNLVDSYFGNISFVIGDKIYISQTGSSMDELEGCVDAVPLDGSSSAGITASSELSAHKGIYSKTGKRAILHGHPKFSVIMSMHCLREGCDRALCYKSCKYERDVLGVPVVSGEIGTGPTGLVHTVPPAMKKGKGVIVYGHGVFTAGDDDFIEPFNQLRNIEDTCRREYFKRVIELYNVFQNPSIFC